MAGLFALGSAPPGLAGNTILSTTDERYYAALGRFIVAYAAVEGSVHYYARKLSGLKESKARIVFGGARQGDVMTKIRQLLRDRNAPDKIYKDADSCFTHLDAVGKQRDKLAHRFVEYKGNAFFVTNKDTAKSALLIEQDTVTLQDLYEMERDCYVINLRLTRLARGRKAGKLSPETRKKYYGPWSYKPPKQSPPKKANPTALALAKALLQGGPS